MNICNSVAILCNSVNTYLINFCKSHIVFSMKLTINTSDNFIEPEIIVNCRCINEYIEKVINSIKSLDMKITGRKDGCEYILEIADIVYIENIEKRTFLYTLSDTYESPFRLYELEVKLVSLDFLKASRYCLVNMKYIKSIEMELNSRLIITMPRDIKLIVSRQYASEIKQKLESYHV